MIVRPVLCRPFIGRRQELAYLRERRLEAGLSHGGLVLIAGDAGVGKSRLISEFCTSLAYSRWRIGYGACLEFASRPYGPILEVLARADTGTFELGAAATKREQLDAIAGRFETIAARTAMIAALEDLHWADAATLDLLAYLAPKLGNMRVLVVASVRGDELHPGNPSTRAIARIAATSGTGRINLGPLRGSELRSFIDEALSGIPLPEETRRAVALAGEGNPFFTEELLKSAVERSSGQDARDRRDLPNDVRTTLLERLHPFDENERRVVSQAAVIGRSFGLTLLAETLNAEPVEILPVLRRARDFQLVEEVNPDVFRFRHGLTRDAIYDEFLGAEVQPRHRTIGLALEAAPPAERPLEALAYHWWAARDADKATRYNEIAGDAAADVHAHEDAIAFYERALEFEMDAVARGCLVQKIADRRLALSTTKEAQATYAAAADIFREAGAYEREAGCRASAAITAYGTGLAEPIAPLEAMLTRLGNEEYLARSRVHLGLAWLAATFGFPTRAGHHLRLVDARALLEAPDVALRFHNVSAFVAMTIGDLETFRNEFAAWVAAAEASGTLATVAGAHINGAMCFSFFGLHEEAEEQVEHALRVARQARSRHCEEMVHAFAALCWLMRGNLERARAEVEQVSTSSDNHVSIVFATAWGTVIAAAIDDKPLIEKWFDGFESTMGAKPDIECGAGFSEILMRRGRDRDAAALLHRALPECELVRGNVLTLLAVGRYGSREDRERARTYLERAAAGEMEMPERPALALFDALDRSRDGHTIEAASLARDAAAGFHRLRLPLLEAQALEAAADIDGALALFRRCGAAYDVRRLGADRVAENGAFNLLSARELEIATLAAGGESNLEIAQRLSITHKTVEKHLASAYQKLGISSRTQLGAYVNAETVM
jgi:DNA-binding CsgD family transcriptional regulator/tetratricopeptide (TPR) repeat protein